MGRVPSEVRALGRGLEVADPNVVVLLYPVVYEPPGFWPRPVHARISELAECQGADGDRLHPALWRLGGRLQRHVRLAYGHDTRSQLALREVARIRLHKL